MMHVALGQKWLASCAPEYLPEERKAFLLGTVFPDIRYLGVIKREKTHFRQVTLDKIMQVDTPFERGLLLHSFVDEFRAQWIRQHQVEKLLEKVPLAVRGVFLKLLEDEMIYPQYNWGEFRGYLITILPEEKAFSVDMQSLIEWHMGLTVYFSMLPSVFLARLSLLDDAIFMLDARNVKSFSVLLPKYAQESVMQGYSQALLNAFEKCLRTCAVE